MSNYKYLTFIPSRAYDFEVVSKVNSKNIGNLILDIDGYYYFEPTDQRGYWSSYWMKELCNKLDELNIQNEQLR